MFRKFIEAEIEKQLNLRTIRPDKQLTMSGYHPLPEIMGNLFEWIFIPFNGSEILVEVRYPTATQIPEVDKLRTVIEPIIERKFKRNELIEYLNLQEMCCKAVLNKPTFEELEKEIHGRDKIRETNLKKIEEMRERLKEVTDDITKQTLEKEIDETEIYCGYSLPADTMKFLTELAYGIGKSDIQKLTKDKLLNA